MRAILPPITEARCPTCRTVYRCTITLRPPPTPRCQSCGKDMRWLVSPQIDPRVPRILPEWVS